MIRYRTSAEAASAIMQDGAVVLHMGTKRYYSLNESGALIWSLLEQNISEEEIVNRLVSRYEVDGNVAADALASLVVKLADANLVQPVAA
ncbi:MAG: PqqD family protein [Gemmatimonadaceae bacterium]